MRHDVRVLAKGRPGPAATSRLTVIRAVPDDADRLSSIAHVAKAHWGYPESWLKRWEAGLTVTPGYIRMNPTYRLVAEGRVVGFVALILRPREAFLDHLWVLPSGMGQGGGRQLFQGAEAVARAAGAVCLKVESDPHAEGFYLRMGAVRRGQVPAPMEGRERFLPLLVKVL